MISNMNIYIYIEKKAWISFEIQKATKQISHALFKSKVFSQTRLLLETFFDENWL